MLYGNINSTLELSHFPRLLNSLVIEMVLVGPEVSLLYTKQTGHADRYYRIFFGVTVGSMGL